MKKEERKELEREFWKNFRENIGDAPKDKIIAVVSVLAFLSVLSAIAALVWLH